MDIGTERENGITMRHFASDRASGYELVAMRELMNWTAGRAVNGTKEKKRKKEGKWNKSGTKESLAFQLFHAIVSGTRTSGST